MLLFECKLEIDQHQTKATDDSVADENRPEFQPKTIHHPHNGTREYNQDHRHAQVAHAAGLPGFVNLGHKGNAT